MGIFGAVAEFSWPRILYGKLAETRKHFCRMNTESVIISRMKGTRTCVVLFIFLSTAIYLSGCASDSGWGASYGGAQLQPDTGRPTVFTGEAPSGSGSVPYIHEGPF